MTDRELARITGRPFDAYEMLDHAELRERIDDMESRNAPLTEEEKSEEKGQVTE